MGQDIPVGPKRTAGISGRCSEAWAIAPRLRVEASGSWWKLVEDKEDMERGQEEAGRGRKHRKVTVRNNNPP